MYLDPDSLPCDDFRKSWNHCTISQGREVSFLYRTGILLTPPLSPEDRPTGLVHLDKFKAKRVQDGLDSRIGIPRDDAVNDSQPSPSYTP